MPGAGKPRARLWVGELFAMRRILVLFRWLNYNVRPTSARCQGASRASQEEVRVTATGKGLKFPQLQQTPRWLSPADSATGIILPAALVQV